MLARINLDAEIRDHRIDDANTCFVVDDFFENPGEIVDFAAQHREQFEMPERAYPGEVLDLEPGAFDEVSRFIRFRMNRLFDYARSGLRTSAQLSLTTLQPENFTWIQRLCHTDPRHDPARRNFALLVYLFENEALGGTGFYRLRDEDFWREMAQKQRNDPQAGLATIEARYPMFREPPRYMTGSNDVAELLTMVPARFNRMICYSGEVPHNAFIEDAALLSEDPRKGRLTFNAFADAIPLR